MDQVESIPGEPLRFIVKSRRKDVDPYLIDLEEYDFNGKCTCDDFQFRHEPKAVRGAHPSNDTRCWHILRARAFFLDLQLRAIAAAQSMATT